MYIQRACNPHPFPPLSLPVFSPLFQRSWYSRTARAAEAAQRACNEAEYAWLEALRAANSPLRDANAARNNQPLMRILLEPQWHLGVCVWTRVNIGRLPLTKQYMCREQA